MPAPAYSARLTLTKPSCRGGNGREEKRKGEGGGGGEREGERGGEREREGGGKEKEIKRLTRLEILELSLTGREVTCKCTVHVDHDNQSCVCVSVCHKQTVQNW